MGEDRVEVDARAADLAVEAEARVAAAVAEQAIDRGAGTGQADRAVGADHGRAVGEHGHVERAVPAAAAIDTRQAGEAERAVQATVGLKARHGDVRMGLRGQHRLGGDGDPAVGADVGDRDVRVVRRDRGDAVGAEVLVDRAVLAVEPHHARHRLAADRSVAAEQEPAAGVEVDVEALEDLADLVPDHAVRAQAGSSRPSARSRTTPSCGRRSTNASGFLIRYSPSTIWPSGSSVSGPGMRRPPR